MPTLAARFTLAIAATAIALLMSPARWSPLPIGIETAAAQSFGRLSTEQSHQVYEQLPDLPLENHYVSLASGEVAADNTLVSRLIQYHVYVKSRPSNYRLDWKLTLADYLGVNDWMIEANYPGATSLQQNPMAGDVAAIGQLSRAERDALVTALVNLFNAGTEAEAGNQPTAPAAGAVQSQPGAAQFLQP